MRHAWNASWITSTQPKATPEPELTVEMMFVTHQIPKSAPLEERLRKPALLRRSFEVAAKPIAKAELRMTAHGVYHATVNGHEVTDAVLTPDFTSYGKFLMYQTYDVTALLAAGENVWGVELADGWYVGRISATGDSCQFGDQLAALGELEVTYEDGTTQLVCTDNSWACSTGRRTYADLFIGEKDDLRNDQPGWDAPGFDASGWEPTPVIATPSDAAMYAPLAPQEGPATVRRERLAASGWWCEDEPDGSTSIVVDFDQVIAGRVQLSCHLDEGQEIRLEHSEVLDENDRFFSNIQGRNKDQTDVFVGRGQDETLEPLFTFHGFRYVRISGWRGDFDPTCITAVTISSGLRQTGHLVTSDKRLNKLMENIEWSQRGNMLSIPTDCPQRERAGWTGDFQVFAPTATFFQDVESFARRWLRSVRADQTSDGQIVDYSPAPKCLFTTGLFGSYSSCGWGDAIVMVPWTLYQRYGHREVLEENYDAMLRWHEFCRTSAAGDKTGDDRYVWDTKFHYGDWMFPSFMLGPDAKGPIETAMATKDLVATAFLSHVSALTAQVARVLGHEDDARELDAYAAEVRRVFVERFYAGHGRMSAEFQGCYVLPLAFDLLPDLERQAVADHLSQMITANGDRLDTGFLSVPYLLDVLGEYGHGDQAERLLWQDSCPSWLYEVDHGATTIWESWGAIDTDGSVGVYSFNHYAFGCVGDWIVRHVGGLSVREPGFVEFDVAPAQVGGVDFSELEYQSVAGTIRVRWERGEDGVRLELTVPEGAIAHVHLPGKAERTLPGGSYVL